MVQLTDNSSNKSGCGCQMEAQNRQQRQVLLILLVLNGVMFVAEIMLGLYSQSTALIADSLDMLADATVYGIGLYAVGRSLLARSRAAYLSGVAQIGLGGVVLLDVSRRFILGSEPLSRFMILTGLLALLVNLVCLKLISKYRDGEIHMRASWVFSKNDVIANLGTILAGMLVYLTGSRLPDLVIGTLVCLVVIKGGLSILHDTKTEPAGQARS